MLSMKSFYNYKQQFEYMATEQTEKLVTVTAKAAEKIQEYLHAEKEHPEYLRVYVQGGGCSGLS